MISKELKMVKILWVLEDKVLKLELVEVDI